MMRLKAWMHSNGVIEAVLDTERSIEKVEEFENVPLSRFLNALSSQRLDENAVSKFVEHGVWHLHIIGLENVGWYNGTKKWHYRKVLRMAKTTDKRTIKRLLRYQKKTE